MRQKYSQIVFATLLIMLFSFSSQAKADSQKVAKVPNEICPILIGSQVPAITLQTIDGKSFDLNRALAKKPTILIYFRGGW